MALRNIPKRIALFGDKARATTHIGEADAFLVEVERMASFQNLLQYQDERTLRDGTHIRAEIRFGCPKVTISSPFYGVAPKKRKPESSRYGRIIVGSCLVNGVARAALWKSWNREWELIDILPGFAQSEARAISENGKVIIGGCASPTGFGQRAYRWTVSGGTKPLNVGSDISGAGDSTCHGISASGRVITGAVGLPGTNTITAFAWNQDTGARAFLRDLFPPQISSFGYGVSGDGKVVVGGVGTTVGGAGSFIDANYLSETPPSPYEQQGYYWSDVHGPELFYPESAQGGEAMAVSPDGNFIAGFFSIYFAYLYDIAEQVMVAPDPQGYRNIPWAISRNGEVTVGYSQYTSNHNVVRGFVWKKGDQFIRKLPLIPGAIQNNALGVSDDGTIILGQTKVAGKYYGFYQIGDNPAVALGTIAGGDGSLAFDISGPIFIEEER